MKEWVQPSLTHPALKDMWVRVSTALDGSVFSLLLVFLDSLLSQRMKVMGGNMIFPRERQTSDWRDLTGPWATNNGQFDKLTERTIKTRPLSLPKGHTFVTLKSGPWVCRRATLRAYSLPLPHRLCQLRVCGVPFLFFLSLPVLQSRILPSLAMVYIDLIHSMPTD
jgi:hypothetical protein